MKSSGSRWPIEHLGTLCDVSIGRTPARNRADYWGQGAPWLSIADMSQGREIADTKESITAAAIEECNCRPVSTGTVLLSFKLSIGKVGIAGRNLFTNEAIAALPIRDTNRLRSDFLYWALKSNDLTVGRDRAAKGITLNKAKLLKIPIPVPPIDEQGQIAAILDKADGLRAKRRAALGQLDTLAQSLFVDMFGDPGAAQKDQTVRLGEDLVFVTSGGRGWAKFYTPSGDRFIRSLDVRENFIADDDAVFVSVPDSAEARRTQVRPGDVLLTITGSRIGRVAPVSAVHGGAFISQHVAILRPAPARLEPLFLSTYLGLEAGGQRQIAKVQYGQAKPGLNFNQIRDFRIPKASLGAQQEFVRRVNAVTAIRIDQVKAQVRSDTLFASLQHRAFRGEL